MKCNNCGKENNDDALFCSECGRALIDKPIDLDLKQITTPASARQAHIVKVSAAAKSSVDKKAENSESLKAVKLDDGNLPDDFDIADTDDENDQDRDCDDLIKELVLDDDDAEAIDTDSDTDEDAPVQQEGTESKAEDTENGEVPLGEYISMDGSIPKDTNEAADKKAETENNTESEEKEEKIIGQSDNNEFKPDADVDKIFRPMRKRDWLAVMVIGAIPVVNIVMYFIWSFAVKVNRSKKTYAQTSLLIAAVMLVLCLLIGVILYFTLGPNFAQTLKNYASSSLK